MGKNYEKIVPQNPEDRAALEKAANSIDIAEAMNECLWLGDRNHKTIYINPVYEKTSGYTLQEAIGQPSDFCFDEATKKTIEHHHQLRKKGVSSQYEGTMISKSGKKIPLLISGAPTSSGGTIGIFTNLTKLKHLARREKITRQILKFSTEAIVILDQNRKITLWNNGATRIFGHREEDVLGKSIDIIIPEEETASNQELLEEVDLKGYIKNTDGRRRTNTGEIIDVLISVTKVIDDGNNLIGYLVIYRDVTQQKRTNNELQKRFETIQDAYKELGLQRRHLDYLYEIIESTVDPSITLESLEKLIVSALCLLTKCDASILRIYDAPRKILKLAASFGVSPKWLDKHQVKFENSLASEAFDNKRPIIIDDIDSNPKHQGSSLLKMHRFKTMVLIPLLVDQKIFGTISLYATAATKFRMIETDFLEKIGKQCSIALFAKRISQKK